MTAFLIALVPSVGVLLLFWIGIKALVEADRRERAAQARIEAAEHRNNAVRPRRPVSDDGVPARPREPEDGGGSPLAG